jgi:hypothetical protein
MGEAMQALCFFAGANSIFYGEQLLTTDNPDTNADQILFKRLGINQCERYSKRDFILFLYTCCSTHQKISSTFFILSNTGMGGGGGGEGFGI